MERIKKYYESYGEDIRLDKDNSHKIEYLTTVHFFDRLIAPGSRILDMGAATGKYTFYLAGKGHDVSALDLTPGNVEIMRTKLEGFQNKSNVHIYEGDGRDLSRFEDESFDVVLCMGPIYHLRDREEKMKALEEGLRVLKKDGIMAAAYINKFAVCTFQVSVNKEFLKSEGLMNIIEKGFEFGDERDIFYFSSPGEIEGMMKEFGVSTIANIAADGVGYMLRDVINGLDEEELSLWMNYHLRTCLEPSILGQSLHGLYICRKV